MASNQQQQQHDDPLQFLQKCYPQESKHYLLRLLRKYDGDVDQVCAYLTQQAFHKDNKSNEVITSHIQEEGTLEQPSSIEMQDTYLTITKRDDWPQDIQQVYLDGNNMMFVVDSLRRLCLNRAGKKTERAIAQIASAWNEQMHIPNVDLIYDSTEQLDQIGSVNVSSAQPRYKTTDDMLIEIVRRNENRDKNQHTIVVTSDRALAIHLKREGCQLVTSYMWFAHCVMVLTPDLIRQDEITIMTPAAKKVRYNFDELVRRIVKFDP